MVSGQWLQLRSVKCICFLFDQQLLSTIFQVHANQLSHIQKGCLTRPRDNITTDGSHIEGTHKGWNSMMRLFASSLEVMNALRHNHVL